MGLVYDHAGQVVRRIYDWRIDGPAICDPDQQFPAGKRFATQWRELRDEALSLMPSLETVPRFHEIMHEQTPISANDGKDWRLCILKAYGVEVAPNMARCPVFAGLVRDIPDVLSASYSFMAPGKHIPAHRGPFRGVLRYYLVLSMPLLPDGRPGAVLRVAGQDYRLTDGQDMVWDDTFPHEVWNESDEVRVVLLLDVRRHDLPLDMLLFTKLLVAFAGANVRLRGVPA
ncbi:MAG TPA: aspartyl/asparaginyl beta-hydroxylase domain-containing protein [Stellaceae bacterium]|jgi:aspartate beta-hydroxylase|nr:aspartyl/asparaginyl beta-hydroxylase domain-containing protein [Stellaceae bacterium]